MRDLLNIINEMAADAVDSLKAQLADRIRTLPADDKSIKTLREIEDLLRDINAGGFKGLLKKDLESINDPAVHQNQKTLAMYINGIEGDIDERKELFDIWRKDTLVNKDALFSGNDVTFSEIFNKYDTNNFVKELVDTIMPLNATGHGKGEFGLNVFSRDINKPVGSKGDLMVNYHGKTLHVEVKTADRTTSIDSETQEEKTSVSSARFSDQEVGVSDRWVEVAKDLNNFVRGLGSYSKRKGPKFEVPPAGINLGKAIDIYVKLTGKEKSDYIDKVENVVSAIFGREGKISRPEYVKRLKKNIKDIVSAIKSADFNNAKQAYTNATFNYYMAKKNDDGVLFLDLDKKMAVWYDSAEALKEKGLRLDAKTIFLTGTNDPNRSAYPQIWVVPTTQGGEAAQKRIKKIAKGKNPFKDPMFVQHLQDWTMQLLRDRNITNSRLIDSVSKATVAFFQAGVPTDQIVASLENKFPALRVPVARTVQRQQQAQTATPTAMPAAAPAPAPATQTAPAAVAPANPAAVQPTAPIQPTAPRAKRGEPTRGTR